jgi:HK97 family phage major capsid protein
MKVDIQALAKERKEAIAAGQAICEAAKTAGEDLTDDQLAEVQVHVAKADELKGKIEAAEKRAIAQAAMFTALDTAGEWDASPQQRITAPVNPNPVSNPVITGGRDAERFSSFGEQLNAICQADSPGGKANLDPRLLGLQAAISGSGSTVASDGGFLVQDDYANEILKLAHSGSEIVSRVRKIPISANSDGLTINAIAETSRASGSRWGGVQVYRLEEGGQMTSKKPKLRQVKWELKDLCGLWYATNKLLQDAIAMQSVAEQAFSEEIAFVVEDEIINGDGASQMAGILNSKALVSITKESGQAATTLVKENIDKMFARCWAPSRKNAVWLINQDVEPQLFSMTQDVGTGGVPVYLPPGNNISGAPHGMLYGRPVVPIEHCQTLGTKGDIVLADLSQYIMIEKGGVQADSSIHLRFDYNETAFRWVIRNDGKTPWNLPLTPAHGTNTLAPFTALNARA